MSEYTFNLGDYILNRDLREAGVDADDKTQKRLTGMYPFQVFTVCGIYGEPIYYIKEYFSCDTAVSHDGC